MTVRAKMRVVELKQSFWNGGGPDGVDGVTIKLQPVYDGDPASPNYSWSKATPSGEVTMQITNPAAYEQFKPGRCYFVDFSPAD